MGNRDKLLASAKQLIAEKGYGEITARDLVTASQTNLASIGYHFGSKDALLTEAVLDSFGDWGDDVTSTIGTITATDPVERLAAVLDALATAFERDRSTTIASVEAFARSPRSPEVRERLAALYAEFRSQVAAVILGAEQNGDERHVGSLGLALIDGVALQWLVDPEQAPSGADIATALRALSAPAGAGEEG
ncbi:TetR/AcrR family transcriptional regulator [Kribbella sp. NPDC023972]|uniref:TetR/AcrR family transcriptional regulator n=1 Tax=Kribbella sp. NPDC023972 TaxID=3154795 RepID=UPI0033C75463